MNPTPEIIPEHQRRRPSTIAEQATLNFHKDLQGLRDYNASVRKFIFLVFFSLFKKLVKSPHTRRPEIKFRLSIHRPNNRMLKNTAKIIRQMPRFRFHLVDFFGNTPLLKFWLSEKHTKFAQSSSCFVHLLSKRPKHKEEFFSNFVYFLEFPNFKN